MKKLTPIPYAKIRKEILANPKVKTTYDNLADEFKLADTLIAARVKAGISQSELAKKMGTSQSAIARMESGKLPSLNSLKRYAQAIEGKLSIQLQV